MWLNCIILSCVVMLVCVCVHVWTLGMTRWCKQSLRLCVCMCVHAALSCLSPPVELTRAVGAVSWWVTTSSLPSAEPTTLPPTHADTDSSHFSSLFVSSLWSWHFCTLCDVSSECSCTVCHDLISLARCMCHYQVILCMMCIMKVSIIICKCWSCINYILILYYNKLSVAVMY